MDGCVGMGVKVGMRDAGDAGATSNHTGPHSGKLSMRGVGAGRERALHGHLYHKSTSLFSCTSYVF